MKISGTASDGILNPRYFFVNNYSTTKKLILLIWLNIHLLWNCRRCILSSYCFTGNRNSMFCTIHVSKFCMKFGNSAWNWVIWLSGNF